jgi:hypothetical protein
MFGIIGASLGKAQYLLLLLPVSSPAAFAAAAPPWALTRTIVHRALGPGRCYSNSSQKLFFIFLLFLFDI